MRPPGLRLRFEFFASASTSQSIRTALRTGGRFVYEGERVERGNRAVERTAYVRRLDLEPDRNEEVAQHLRRASSALLEH